jgi:hypothetical protein
LGKIIEGDLGEVANNVYSAVLEMKSATSSMSDMSKDTKDRSEGVAKASEESSSNIQTVAAAQ